MENPEEILHSLEEFSKMKPKDIPRELEDYLCFVAKTGDPVYQWSAIKSLFREKLINVITEFYESCPSVDIPPCPNVELFNYDLMKNFILDKLDTFAAAPFTVQRICELLTAPRKEYNRIDKYMRALEKNILVVSTSDPGGRRGTENGDSMVNGIESEHQAETSNCSHDINVEEMDDTPVWSRNSPQAVLTPCQNNDTNNRVAVSPEVTPRDVFVTDLNSTTSDTATSSPQGTVIACQSSEEQPYVSIEPVQPNSDVHQEAQETDETNVTITAIPAGVQKRRGSVEPVPNESTEPQVKEADQFEKEKPTIEEPKPEQQESVIEEQQKDSEPMETQLVQIADGSNILLAPVNSGIENISPESTTSSPENLQELQEDSEVISTVDEKSTDEIILEVEKSIEDTSVTSSKHSEEDQNKEKEQETPTVIESRETEDENSIVTSSNAEEKAKQADVIAQETKVDKIEESSNNAEVSSGVSEKKEEILEANEDLPHSPSNSKEVVPPPDSNDVPDSINSTSVTSEISETPMEVDVASDALKVDDADN